MAPDPGNPDAAPAPTPAPPAPTRNKLGLLGKCLFSGLGLAIFLLYLNFALNFATIINELKAPAVSAMAFPLNGGYVIALLPALTPWLLPLAFRRLTKTWEILIHIALVIAALAMFVFLFIGMTQELQDLIPRLSPAQP